MPPHLKSLLDKAQKALHLPSQASNEEQPPPTGLQAAVKTTLAQLTQGLSGNPPDTMPGKSNKFDYSKRGTTGPKLGAIISRDLLKKVEEVRKHSRQSDSSSTGSSGTRSVSATSVSANSQDLPTYVLDLKVPGKALGDEGIAAMLVGLEAAAGCHLIILEDLDISGNGITVKVLPLLVKTIELARFTLKTVNISGNELHILDPIQMGYWEVFLRSFERCGRLRRLDFSNNLDIGAGAFEVMARLHARERPVDPIPVAGAASVHSLDDDDGKAKTSIPINLLNAPKAMDQSQYLRRRLGLRSIPYISFNNVSFDDNCAIWLSYILIDHFFPSQLIDKLNATRADTHVEVYQQQQIAMAQAGFEWAYNEGTLSKDGAHLLNVAAKLREYTMTGNQEDIGDPSAASGSAQSQIQGTRGIAEIPTINDVLDNVEKSRLKLQRQQISLHGIKCGQIWLVALQTIRSARLIMLLKPIRKGFNGQPFTTTGKGILTAAGSINTSLSHAVMAQGSAEYQVQTQLLSSDNGETISPNAAFSAMRSYATTPTASEEHGRENLVQTTINSFARPTLPKPKWSGRQRSPAGEEMENLTQTLDEATIGNEKPFRFVQYQQQQLAGNEKAYRDTKLNLSHLPLHIVCRIAKYTLLDWYQGVLSEVQQASAVKWGLTRGTLAHEMGWRKIDESAQVLMLLREVGCLTY